MKKVFFFFFVSTLGWAEQCQITSPLPVPVLLSGCTYSGSLPNNSTSYIQNTLSPTTTTQMFSVQQGSMTTGATLGYVAGTQCLHSVNGAVSGTGADCGSGGGGGGSSLVSLSTGIVTPAIFVASVTVQSSMSITGDGGLNVTYGVTASTMTGAGLGLCGDSTHALGFTSTNTFTCQTLTGGGGGGASSLAMGLGSSSTFVTQISSPTQPLSFDMSQFSGQLLGTTTGFVTIAYSTNAKTASYTLVSTDTVVEMNCASACTATLPTAINRSGKRFYIKMLGVGPVTIATVASQTIDGSTTIIPNPSQYTDIEVEADGSNYDIL